MIRWLWWWKVLASDVGRQYYANAESECGRCLLSWNFCMLSHMYFHTFHSFSYCSSHRVLEIQKSSGFDDLGGVKPSMALCLAFVFVLVYFALWKGPKSSGKVSCTFLFLPWFERVLERRGHSAIVKRISMVAKNCLVEQHMRLRPLRMNDWLTEYERMTFLSC